MASHSEVPSQQVSLTEEPSAKFLSQKTAIDISGEFIPSIDVVIFYTSPELFEGTLRLRIMFESCRYSGKGGDEFNRAKNKLIALFNADRFESERDDLSDLQKALTMAVVILQLEVRGSEEILMDFFEHVTVVK